MGILTKICRNCRAPKHLGEFSKWSRACLKCEKVEPPPVKECRACGQQCLLTEFSKWSRECEACELTAPPTIKTNVCLDCGPTENAFENGRRRCVVCQLSVDQRVILGEAAGRVQKPAGVRKCLACAEVKEKVEFDLRRRICRTCLEDPSDIRRNDKKRRYRAKHPDRVREQNRQYRLAYPEKHFASKLRKYGLTLHMYQAILEKQAGRCAICAADFSGMRPVDIHVDHEHKSGLVRGVLCGKCNPGLGMFRDNPAWLRTAAEYLEATSVFRTIEEKPTGIL